MEGPTVYRRLPDVRSLRILIVQAVHPHECRRPLNPRASTRTRSSLRSNYLDGDLEPLDPVTGSVVRDANQIIVIANDGTELRGGVNGSVGRLQIGLDKTYYESVG